MTQSSGKDIPAGTGRRGGRKGFGFSFFSRFQSLLLYWWWGKTSLRWESPGHRLTSDSPWIWELCTLSLSLRVLGIQERATIPKFRQFGAPIPVSCAFQLISQQPNTRAPVEAFARDWLAWKENSLGLLDAHLQGYKFSSYLISIPASVSHGTAI